METIRIPRRYKKQISRLKDKEKIWFLDSLFLLSSGFDVKIPDSNEGDILELVWRDCLQMAKKSRDFNQGLIGSIVDSSCATMSPTMSPTEMKGNEMKGNEVKGNSGTKKFVPPTIGETQNYFIEHDSCENSAIDFWEFYESKGWMVGKNKMKKWQSAASRWIRQNSEKDQTNPIRALDQISARLQRDPKSFTLDEARQLKKSPEHLRVLKQLRYDQWVIITEFE